MNKQEAKKHIIGMLVSGREFCSSKDTRKALLEYNNESCPHSTRLSIYTLFEKSESGIDAMRDALDEAISAIKGTDAEALKQAECKWKENDPNGPMPQTWDAECGLSWYLAKGRPSDNDMTCCPACGNELVDVKFEEDES